LLHVFQLSSSFIRAVGAAGGRLQNSGPVSFGVGCCSCHKLVQIATPAGIVVELPAVGEKALLRVAMARRAAESKNY
jgi:hypothetical protein